MPETESQNISKGAARRAQILELARTVLIERGYDAFVMREIATELNMKLGNLQYYFPSRESLIEAIVSQEAQTDRDDLRTLASQEVGGIAQLTAFVKFIVKKWRGDSGKIMATMGFLALHRTPFRVTYKEVYSHFYKDLAAMIEGIDPGQRPQTYIRRARLMTALLDGAAMQVQRGNSPDFLNDVAVLALQIACPDR